VTFTFRVVRAWDFPESKGYDLMLGEHVEGQIIWGTREFFESEGVDKGTGYHASLYNGDGLDYEPPTELGCQRTFKAALDLAHEEFARRLGR
jgi:hypothetical protein